MPYTLSMAASEQVLENFFLVDSPMCLKSIWDHSKKQSTIAIIFKLGEWQVDCILPRNTSEVVVNDLCTQLDKMFVSANAQLSLLTIYTSSQCHCLEVLTCRAHIRIFLLSLACNSTLQHPPLCLYVAENQVASCDIPAPFKAFWGWQLYEKGSDSVILMGPYQLGIFYHSVKHKVILKRHSSWTNSAILLHCSNESTSIQRSRSHPPA